GWHVFGLPGNFIAKFEPEQDSPWSPHGVKGMFIEDDGTMTIHRYGYLDRNDKYVISPEGNLRKYKETNGMFAGRDISGSQRSDSKILIDGILVQVRMNDLYYEWRRHLRDGLVSSDLNPDDFVAMLNKSAMEYEEKLGKLNAEKAGGEVSAAELPE